MKQSFSAPLYLIIIDFSLRKVYTWLSSKPYIMEEIHARIYSSCSSTDIRWGMALEAIYITESVLRESN